MNKQEVIARVNEHRDFVKYGEDQLTMEEPIIDIAIITGTMIRGDWGDWGDSQKNEALCEAVVEAYRLLAEENAIFTAAYNSIKELWNNMDMLEYDGRWIRDAQYGYDYLTNMKKVIDAMTYKTPQEMMAANKFKLTVKTHYTMYVEDAKTGQVASYDYDDKQTPDELWEKLLIAANEIEARYM